MLRGQNTRHMPSSCGGQLCRAKSYSPGQGCLQTGPSPGEGGKLRSNSRCRDQSEISQASHAERSEKRKKKDRKRSISHLAWCNTLGPPRRDILFSPGYKEQKRRNVSHPLQVSVSTPLDVSLPLSPQTHRSADKTEIVLQGRPVMVTGIDDKVHGGRQESCQLIVGFWTGAMGVTRRRGVMWNARPDAREREAPLGGRIEERKGLTASCPCGICTDAR